MRYVALATDYDGTLASGGHVDQPTFDSLQRFVESGRKLVMVTGRQLDDLQSVFPCLELFSCVVAENGALLYDPKSKSQRILAEPPNPAFVDELSRRGVPVSTGKVIVATWRPHEKTVFDIIRQQALDFQIILNKASVMVLPSAIDKGTGLRRAIAELGLSLHNTIGIGDAENDDAFLSLCGYSVAVANALGSLKKRVNLVTEGTRGSGVAELIDQVLQDELRLPVFLPGLLKP
jgi:hydroxymethylpyrimidine pyrophosphatase-like HAD family hydrolase